MWSLPPVNFVTRAARLRFWFDSDRGADAAPRRCLLARAMGLNILEMHNSGSCRKAHRRLVIIEM